MDLNIQILAYTFNYCSVQDYCKEVILHFRDLAGLKKERQTAHYRQEKRKLYHFMISKVLAEFDAIRKEGGISVEYQGSTIKLWPAVLFVITDEIEAQLLSLMTTCTAWEIFLISKTSKNEI